MEKLKIIVLLLAIFAGSPVPAVTIPHEYSHTFKGGIQMSERPKCEKVIVLKVEGSYEYYLRYLKNKLDFKENPDEADNRKSILSPYCVLSDVFTATC